MFTLEVKEKKMKNKSLIQKPLFSIFEKAFDSEHDLNTILEELQEYVDASFVHE